MHVGFYAPLKSPNHPVPSGDRLMARLIMQAMRLAGYTVSLVSEFRSFSRTPAGFASRRAEGEAEATRIAAEWEASAAPDIFFSYHPYYKSPDLLGPALKRRFGIPYVTAEASFSPRRTTGEWAEVQAVAVEAFRAADLNICITKRDRKGLEGLVAADRLAMLPPFLDVEGFLGAQSTLSGVGRPPLRFASQTTSPPIDGGEERRELADVGALPLPHAVGERWFAKQTGVRAQDRLSGEDPIPHLITVAMMRPGDKLESYRMLAQALALCVDVEWHLTVVGDGPCRVDVQTIFSALPEGRVNWLGELVAGKVAEALAASDFYVWPGFGEAYGLTYLEAQASGLPVVAQNIAGVPEVVIDGKTGLLTEAGNVKAYSDAIHRLIADEALRRRMGTEARRFVTTERSLERAAATMKSILARFEP
jgi:glycosyltransferase involved in cell wall biosynthesis